MFDWTWWFAAILTGAFIHSSIHPSRHINEYKNIQALQATRSGRIHSQSKHHRWLPVSCVSFRVPMLATIVLSISNMISGHLRGWTSNTTTTTTKTMAMMMIIYFIFVHLFLANDWTSMFCCSDGDGDGQNTSDWAKGHAHARRRWWLWSATVGRWSQLSLPVVVLVVVVSIAFDAIPLCNRWWWWWQITIKFCFLEEGEKCIKIWESKKRRHSFHVPSDFN